MLFSIFNKKKRKGKDDSLYSFNLEEIEEFNKLNNEKIKKLNNNSIFNGDSNNREDISSNEDDYNNKDVSDIEEKNSIIDENKDEEKDNDIIDESTVIESVENIIEEKKENNFSFINLDKDSQIKIMNNWENIDISELNKDIDKGENIKQHNYTISYCEDAYKYVTYIRDKYSIVIKYLIGFNNEKNGIYNKTIFSDNKIDEWRFLGEYIKLLEKIKNFKVRN